MVLIGNWKILASYIYFSKPIGNWEILALYTPIFYETDRELGTFSPHISCKTDPNIKEFGLQNIVRV